ncbi:MAG TPA: hypothetical protein VNO43_12810 [Candidatus Eisenbacteria bacterium]|nr:hypothetical protein [Candidatus Eisenbacteria bacterium]
MARRPKLIAFGDLYLSLVAALVQTVRVCGSGLCARLPRDT